MAAFLRCGPASSLTANGHHRPFWGADTDGRNWRVLALEFAEPSDSLPAMRTLVMHLLVMCCKRPFSGVRKKRAEICGKRSYCGHETRIRNWQIANFHTHEPEGKLSPFAEIQRIAIRDSFAPMSDVEISLIVT